jgi:hypothetical protein
MKYALEGQLQGKEIRGTFRKAEKQEGKAEGKFFLNAGRRWERREGWEM